MKRSFALVVALQILFSCRLHSQIGQPDPVSELSISQFKYWFYKNRLFSDFVVASSEQSDFERSGFNTPSTQIDIVFDSATLSVQRRIKWGDGTEHLGWYIAVLATESHLHHLAGNTAERDKTNGYLRGALAAFDRLDWKSAYLYAGAGYSSNNTFRRTDGFFIRDDVEPGFHLHPNFLDEHGNPRYENEISTHKFAMLFGPDWAQGPLIGQRPDNPLYGEYGAITTMDGFFEQWRNAEMSQDHAIWIMMGLAFVIRFVDDATLVQQARAQFERIYRTLRNDEYADFQIRNPHLVFHCYEAWFPTGPLPRGHQNYPWSSDCFGPPLDRCYNPYTEVIPTEPGPRPRGRPDRCRSTLILKTDPDESKVTRGHSAYYFAWLYQKAGSRFLGRRVPGTRTPLHTSFPANQVNWNQASALITRVVMPSRIGCHAMCNLMPDCPCLTPIDELDNCDRRRLFCVGEVEILTMVPTAGVSVALSIIAQLAIACGSLPPSVPTPNFGGTFVNLCAYDNCRNLDICVHGTNFFGTRTDCRVNLSELNAKNFFNAPMYSALACLGQPLTSSKTNEKLGYIGLQQKCEIYALLDAVLNGKQSVSIDLALYKNLITSAPCQGPYDYKKLDGSIVYDGTTGQNNWKKSNRFVAVPNECQDPHPDNEWKEYNGLDYMLLHNLFMIHSRRWVPGLSAEMVPFENMIDRVTNVEYPILVDTRDSDGNWTTELRGTSSNPLTVMAVRTLRTNDRVLEASQNPHNEDGGVVYRAGDEIILGDDYHACLGCDVHVVTEIVCDPVSNRYQKRAFSYEDEYEGLRQLNLLSLEHVPAESLDPSLAFQDDLEDLPEEDWGSSSVSESTSIQMAEYEQPRLYPNPFQDFLAIQLPDTWVGFSVVVSVLSESSGAVLLRLQIDACSAQIDVPTHGLPAGIYILDIQAGPHRSTHKVVKL